LKYPLKNSFIPCTPRGDGTQKDTNEFVANLLAKEASAQALIAKQYGVLTYLDPTFAIRELKQRTIRPNVKFLSNMLKNTVGSNKFDENQARHKRTSATRSRSSHDSRHSYSRHDSKSRRSEKYYNSYEDKRKYNYSSDEDRHKYKYSDEDKRKYNHSSDEDKHKYNHSSDEDKHKYKYTSEDKYSGDEDKHKYENGEEYIQKIEKKKNETHQARGRGSIGFTDQNRGGEDDNMGGMDNEEIELKWVEKSDTCGKKVRKSEKKTQSSKDKSKSKKSKKHKKKRKHDSDDSGDIKIRKKKSNNTSPHPSPLCNF